MGQGIADPDRLRIGGWSYAGHMTSWTVTQTTRFKAAVVGAAVTNLLSFHGTTEIAPNFLKPHSFRERAHQADLLKRVAEWFDKYLKQ